MQLEFVGQRTKEKKAAERDILAIYRGLLIYLAEYLLIHMQGN
jgi:hypothetical protein